MKKKKEIEKGDAVFNMKTSARGTVTQVQYVHNRYQLSDVSGWLYGLSDLAIIPNALPEGESSNESDYNQQKL